MMRAVVILHFVLGCAAAAWAQDGRKTLRLDERSPLGLPGELEKRFGWRGDEPRDAGYEIKKEQFRLRLPRGHDAKKRAGLLVWISPSGNGALPDSWATILDRRGLIGIGADNCGNDRPRAIRIALALDAVQAMKRAHSIDEARVYVAGFSGGGVMASYLTLHYPDVFRAGCYVGGCNYLRDVPIPNGGGALWKGEIPRPDAERLALAKSRTRHVFLFGSADPVRPQMAAVRGLMKDEDGFQGTELLEVPKLEHAIPAASWLERALAFIEARREAH